MQSRWHAVADRGAAELIALYREFGLSLGAERYVLKAIEPEELLQVIGQVLEEAKGGRTSRTSRKRAAP